MCKEKIKFSIIVFVIVIMLSLYLGAVYATDDVKTAQLTKKQIETPIKPAIKPNNELIVFSFYDTQLQVVCYMGNSGMDCLLRKDMSDRAKTFIDHKVTTYKEDLGVGVSKFPRIVPLDE